MPTFGQHEAGLRLHLSGTGGLYALTNDSGGAGGGAKKALRVLQPLEGVWSDDVLRAEIDAFLLRHKLQRQLAKDPGSGGGAGGGGWAPVHEIGTIPTKSGGGTYRAAGAYALLDRYDRSVQSLIDGRVHITNHDLRTIVAAVLRGLLHIRKRLNRPHGNLKPSNILLADAADLAHATVHLSDIAPDGALTSKSDRKDLFDLARIIFELVHLRPYDGGTLGRSREWDALGPNGEDWRALCTALLDTGAAPADLDLEKILARVQTWTARPKKSRMPLLATAALILLIVGGSLTAYFLTRKPHVDFDGPRWEKLCLAYYAWFGDFSKHFADEKVRAQFSSGDYPADIVKLYLDAGKELSRYEPRAIAGKLVSADELALEPGEDVKIDPAPYYTREGVKLIDNVAAALTPERWPLLGKMDKTAADYDTRGWKKAAAGIRALIAAAQPPEIAVPTTQAAEARPAAERVEEVRRLVKQRGGGEKVFATIDATIKASRTVADIDARWARIGVLMKGLPQTDVPLLKALPEFAADLPKSDLEPGHEPSLADVTSLAESFTKIEAVVTQLVADLNPKPGREIIFAELARDPAAQVQGKATLDQYTALPALAANYVKLATDPRDSVPWTKALDTLKSDIIAKIQEANPQDPNLPSLVDRHAKLSAEIAAFGPTSIAPIEKNKIQLLALVSKAKTDLDKLTDDGNTWVAPYIIEPAVYIAGQRDRLTTSPLAKATPAVYAEWQKHHAEFLKKVEAAPADLKKYPIYKAVNDRFDALEKAYLDIDTKIPTAVPGLAELATAADWRGTIARHVATVYREAALKDLMTHPSLMWADDLPQLTDPAYISYQQQRLATFDATRQDTLALLADYVTITDRLDHLHLSANEPAPNAPLWRDLFARYQSHPLAADTTIATALKPLTDRVSALLALDGLNDYKALLEKTNASAPEIVLTAWRKLGTVPIAEDLPVLDDEDKVTATLTSHLNTLAAAQKLAPAQVVAFTTEIAAQRPVRWHRWADTLTSAAAIQEALDKAVAFNVSLTPQNDAAMLYNQALYALRKTFDANPKEPELKAASQAFIDKVKVLPPVVNGDLAIQGLLAAIAKPLSQSQEESSSAGAGPKLAGWEQETPDGRPDIRLFYFPAKSNPRHVLEFIRLQVNEANVPNPNAPPTARGAAALGAGQKTVFLCTTETSIGLFADVLNTSNKFAELDNGKPGNQPHWFSTAGDPWGGPRGWKISSGKFVLDTPSPAAPGGVGWLFPVPQMGGNPYYAPNNTPAAPALEHPMQYLSPWSAMYAARLLGCRLPTSDEWLAAYDRFEATNAVAPKDAWNLRGNAWKIQFDHAAAMARNGLKYPDDTIFLTADLLYAGITAQAAKPWTGDGLAKLAPTRITPGTDPYKGSVLWFRKTAGQPGSQPPGSGTGAMHDLVGNVAEYVFDGPSALAVIKDATPTTAAIDAAVTAGRRTLGVIGGSALSPPEIPFNKKQPLDLTIAQTNTGYADVGFRLAYTAPIDSITDVLAATFKDPKYLPGAKAKAPG
jgi:hypothetical protein